MDGDVPYCPKCGRKPTFRAVFCPYCGTRLPGVAEPVEGLSRRTIPLPDRAELCGPCALLLRDKVRVHIPTVGRLLARFVQRPLSDLTREIRSGHGILARGLAADKAVKLSDELAVKDVSVIAVPETDMLVLPEAERMKSAGFNGAGLDCVAYRWDSTEELHVRWDAIELISGARVELQEVRAEATTENEERLANLAITPPHKIPRLTTAVRLEYVIDFFFGDPLRRLRLDENTSAYSLVNVGSFTDGGREYFRAARAILEHGDPKRLNPAVRLLAGNASADSWLDLTFEAKRDFDAYNLWLLQLLRYGLPIPE